MFVSFRLVSFIFRDLQPTKATKHEMDDAFAELEAQLAEISSNPSSRRNTATSPRVRASVAPVPQNDEWQRRAQLAEQRADALEEKIKKLVQGVKGMCATVYFFRSQINVYFFHTEERILQQKV